MAVKHVGGTSVPGLAAKPIIDIVAGLPTTQSIEVLKDRLCGAGYIYRGEADDGVGHLFVLEPEPDIRTVHIHAVQHGSTYWSEYVCFRDLLRRDAELRDSYDQLKRKNAAAFPDDRKGYTAAKHTFVREVLRTRAGLKWENDGAA